MFGGLKIEEATEEGFVLYVGATDETSGLDKVECIANGDKVVDENLEVNEITEGGIKFTVTGLEELTPYTIVVKVFDRAGLSRTIPGITGETIAAIDPPVVTIANRDIWTGPKTVTIPAVEGYYIKYTTDGTDPTAETTNTLTGTGNQSFTLNHNGTVKAVYYNIEKGNVSKIGEDSTDKIDTLKPNAVAFSASNVTAGPHSMQITISAVTDTPATSESGCSEGIMYNYHCNSFTSGWTSSTTYKFNEVYGNLQGVSCSMYVETKDAAGNSVTSASTSKTTSGMRLEVAVYPSRRAFVDNEWEIL